MKEESRTDRLLIIATCEISATAEFARLSAADAPGDDGYKSRTMQLRESILDVVRPPASKLARLISRIWAHPDRLLTTLALGVGLVTGFGAIGFAALVDWVVELTFGDAAPWLRDFAGTDWLLLLLPASGALLTGLIVYHFAPEAEGHGVPEVMYAISRKGGRIRLRVAGTKAIASALTIGTGGSAGAEGPIIQIGSAIGSNVGQLLRCNISDMGVLIGCGAAAGIAAIFNAPIAGVLFAVEVLLRDLSQRSFVPIMIAAVVSNAVAAGLRGESEPIFPIPSSMVHHEDGGEFAFRELANFALLGVVCGGVAVALVRAMYVSEDLFRKLPVHRVVRPVVGALMLGVMTVLLLPWLNDTPGRAANDPPAIMSFGYATVGRLLDINTYNTAGGWTVALVLVLAAAKIVGTCFTLGSGGSGGVFAPGLFIGATTGAGFGLLVQQTGLFPNINPAGYALVGMAAVIAASMHAPLTATLMLFELTRDYRVILPIMLAAVIALAVAVRFEPASIYTLQLFRRGVRVTTGAIRALQRVVVADLPPVFAPMVRPTESLAHLLTLSRASDAHDFVVTDSHGRFLGMVLGSDLRVLLLETEAMPLLNVSDVMRNDVPVLRPDETLDHVISQFAGQTLHALPIVDRNNVINDGACLTRAAVMARYERSVE